MSMIRAKQRASTQRSILTTARRLFLAGTFDSVGVREIAAEAGVATGTVIAAFGSKVDLLHAIVIEDMAEQLCLMEAAAKTAESAVERITRLCDACITYQSSRAALVRAAMADTWTRSDEAESKIRAAFRPMRQLVYSELQRGVSRGEVRPDLDIKLGALLVLETLVNTYRVPLYTDLAVPELVNVLHRRLDIVMFGFFVPPHEAQVILRSGLKERAA